MNNMPIKTTMIHTALLVTALSLSACGGGGSGGGSDSSTVRTPQLAVYDQFSAFDHVLFATADDGSGQQQIISNGSFQFISDYRLSPTGQYLAMMADDQLYVSALDRMNFIRVSQLNNHAGQVRGYEWSPDGEHLIYLADGETRDKVELYQVDRDGKNLFRISGTIDSSSTLDIASARWSPNGQYVAYLVENNGVAFGLNIHRFTEQEDRNSLRVSQQSRSDTDILGAAGESYKWAPDSSLLAYRQDSHSNNVYTLHTVRPDGSSLIQASVPYVTSFPLGDFRWSPDSRYIAYDFASTTSTLKRVYCYDVQNPGFQGPIVAESDTDIDYQWAHDAPLLAYSSDQRMNSGRQVLVYDATNDSFSQVIHASPAMEDVLSLHWSPKDNYIGYSTASGLYVARPLSQDTATQVVAFDMNSQLLSSWSWSPDESHLAYVTRDGNRRPASSLFYAGLDHADQPTALAGPEIRITDFLPSWSKDASHLLYTSAGQLLSASIARASQRVISGDTSSVMDFAY